MAVSESPLGLLPWHCHETPLKFVTAHEWYDLSWHRPVGAMSLCHETFQETPSVTIILWRCQDSTVKAHGGNAVTLS